MLAFSIVHVSDDQSLQQKMTVMSKNPGTFIVSAILPDRLCFSITPVSELGLSLTGGLV